MTPRTVHTIGHSTRSLEELVAMLQGAGVARLVDIRRYPGSRRHPHFAREALATSLGEAGIEYEWRPELGGRRKPRPDTKHTAWRVAAFAAYADHMETPEFEQTMGEILERAGEASTALMCAEARPEQCHRRLVADWLTVKGHRVVHLMTRTRRVPHALPSFARAEDGRVIYDGGQLSLEGGH
jgi:uncharacterized protein (DUF488 family)